MNLDYTKKYWQSKTFWAVLLSAVVGGYKLMAAEYGWDTRWTEGAIYILGALGLWGIRTADTTITSSRAPEPEVPNNVLPANDGEILPPEGVIQPR